MIPIRSVSSRRGNGRPPGAMRGRGEPCGGEPCDPGGSASIVILPGCRHTPPRFTHGVASALLGGWEFHKPFFAPAPRERAPCSPSATCWRTLPASGVLACPARGGSPCGPHVLHLRAVSGSARFQTAQAMRPDPRISHQFRHGHHGVGAHARPFLAMLAQHGRRIAAGCSFSLTINGLMQ
jgi:hypothetical protein